MGWASGMEVVLRHWHYCSILVVFLLTFTQPVASEPSEVMIDHVVVIGLDGARPDAVQQAAAPRLQRLIDNGAVSWEARSVEPTVTQVNWPSMLTGSRPQTHGITQHPVTEEELEQMSLQAPTIFQVVAESGRLAAGFFGHWKLYSMESQTPNAHFFRSPYNASRVAPRAAEFLEAHQPAFCFIWMGDLDGLGHRHGWMSQEQLAGFEPIDEAIGIIVDAIESTPMRDRTVIMISSDHGGSGRGHSAPEEVNIRIPWIIWGPGVRPGHEIEMPVAIYDTAATALAVLGMEAPGSWDGRPIEDAFESAVGEINP